MPLPPCYRRVLLRLCSTSVYDAQVMAAYQDKRTAVRKAAAHYDAQASLGNLQVIYKFGENLIADQEITISQSEVSIDAFPNSVKLDFDNPYADMV